METDLLRASSQTWKLKVFCTVTESWRDLALKDQCSLKGEMHAGGFPPLLNNQQFLIPDLLQKWCFSFHTHPESMSAPYGAAGVVYSIHGNALRIQGRHRDYPVKE